MNAILAYLLGVVTIPALATIVWLVFEALSTAHGWDCVICGMEARGRRIRVEAVRLWHRAVIFPRPSHRAALRTWRIEHHRDPETGQPMQIPTNVLIPTPDNEGSK